MGTPGQAMLRLAVLLGAAALAAGLCMEEHEVALACTINTAVGAKLGPAFSTARTRQLAGREARARARARARAKEKARARAINARRLRILRPRCSVAWKTNSVCSASLAGSTAR